MTPVQSVYLQLFHALSGTNPNFYSLHSKGLVRYYDVQPDDESDEKKVPIKTVCKNCGAEGKHLTWECPVIIVRTFRPHMYNSCFELSCLVSNVWSAGRASYSKLSY